MMRIEFDNERIEIPGMQYTKNTHRERLAYAVGALLYSPANRPDIADAVIRHKYPKLSSLALCLEDSIADGAEPEARRQLVKTLRELRAALDDGIFSSEELPLVFVRVRSPRQFEEMKESFIELRSVLTGFIFPKFDESCAEDYRRVLEEMNKGGGDTLYAMPILESGSVLSRLTRAESLGNIYKMVNAMEELVLNVRVGGNDFCRFYGLRRSVDETIYDFPILCSVLSDIVNVFGARYVISGPVWEYFANAKSELWKEGLIRELRRDRQCGFVGKTAIHPSQLPVIQRSLVVSRSDYEDAKSILGWTDACLGVAKSAGGDRMNEEKVHGAWAKKILSLADIYGVKRDNADLF